MTPGLTRGRRAALVFAAGLGGCIWIAAAGAQSSISPLPPAEIFTAGDGLTISLHTATPTIRVGDSFVFTLRFENHGRARLVIVPRPVWPVFRPAAQSAMASEISDELDTAARRLPRFIKPEQLIALAPGEQWDMPLDAFSRQPVLLAPGEYTVGFTYVNAPDYQYVYYDPYTMPAGIWEGTVTAAPVRVSVTAPSPDDVARYTDLLKSDRADDLALSFLALSGAGGARALVDQLPLLPRSRMRILLALGRAPTIPMRELIAAIDRLPPYERGSLIASPEFSLLLRVHGSCELLMFLVERFDDFTNVWHGFQSLFADRSGGCPGLGPALRAAVLDPSRNGWGRGTAAGLLGLFPDDGNKQLLLDILEQRLSSVPPPSPWSGDSIRAGAVSGLGLIGGADVVAALARALADERSSSSVTTQIAGALFAIGSPEVVPPLVAALSSSNTTLVTYALAWLRALRAAPAIPSIIPLLGHPNSTVRVYAAGALSDWPDSVVRGAMIAVKDVEDEALRPIVMSYLAKYGDSSMRNWFVSGLASPNAGVREAAVAGLRRFGTADDFPKIRRLFDLPGREAVKGYLPSALGSLTFTPDDYRGVPQVWDDWYAAHRGATRVEWAREALRPTDQQLRQSPLGTAQGAALRYLTEQRDARFLPDFQRAAESTNFGIRVEAARAIAAFDRPKAQRLLLREFGGRFHGACDAANRALNQLTGDSRTVDCRDPQARVKAAEGWARLLQK